MEAAVSTMPQGAPARCELPAEKHVVEPSGIPKGYQLHALHVLVSILSRGTVWRGALGVMRGLGNRSRSPPTVHKQLEETLLGLSLDHPADGRYPGPGYAGEA